MKSKTPTTPTTTPQQPKATSKPPALSSQTSAPTTPTDFKIGDQVQFVQITQEGNGGITLSNIEGEIIHIENNLCEVADTEGFTHEVPMNQIKLADDGCILKDLMLKAL